MRIKTKILGLQSYIMIFISIGLIVAQVWLDLKLPDYMAEITRLVQTEGSKMSGIWRAGGKMLACAISSSLLMVVVGYFAAVVSSSVSMNLRSKVFKKVESFSMNEMKKFSTASLITRSTNDITQIQITVAMGLQAMIKAPIMAVWAITKIAGKSWQWSIATAGAVVGLLLMIMIIVIFAIPKFKKVQILTDNLNKVTRENLTGIRVVRAYNAESFEEKKFEKANDALTQNQLVIGRTMSIMSPGMTFIISSLMLSIYWIGAFLIDKTAPMSRLVVFSDMVVFMSYSMQVVMSFMMLTMIFIFLPRALVAGKRIREILKTEPSVVDGTFDGKTDISGVIEFKNVGFKYPDASEYVLKDISFKVEKGETIAFIGSTGSGKSTLINLVPRFYDATEGEVLIDGVNVKDYTEKALRDKLGYVPQKPVVFSGTIKSNVSFGDNGKEELSNVEIRKALKLSQSASFVDRKDGKENAETMQDGSNLSGGQKQRLAIARAIARDPEILIFDDSFSALDYKTDKKLRDTLKKELKEKTNLIVAQRIGTIKDANKIVVLEKGKMVGIGTHSELVKKCKVYKEIVLSQLSKEELQNV